MPRNASAPFGSRRVRALALAAALALPTAVLLPSVARAEDPAAAQQLFNDARDLMAQNRWADACPKLEESQKLDPGMGTQFNLANCYQHMGKNASAWALFLEVAAEAKNGGQPAREKAARDRAAALQGVIPKLLVIVHGDAAAGLEVKRDNEVVGRGQWGTGVPVDPGTHAITASAPGKKPWRSSVDIPASPRTVTVDISALEDDPAAAVVPSTVGTPAAAVPAGARPGPTVVTGVTNGMPAETVVEERRRSGTGQRVAGGVITLLGIGSVVTGAVFGLESKSRRDEASAHCTGNVCDQTGVSLRSDAVRDGNISTITIGAGAAAIVGGIILFATAPRNTTFAAAPVARSTGVHAAPLVGRGVTGLSFEGAF